MFAGKTEELIRRINVLKRAQKKVIIFFSKISTRYRKNKVVSHNQRFIDAYAVETVAEASALMKKDDFDAVCFDEMQFFDRSFYKFILQLVAANKYVICSGMDKDYWNEYNGLMAKLLIRADNVDKLSAICARCNGSATRTQRVDSQKKAINTYSPKILVGGAEYYEPRCNRCFVEFPNPWTN